MNFTTTESALNQTEADASHWVAEYGDYLFNFAVGQVRDTTTAEDLVQETFLGALKSKGNFGGKSTERTWLVGILRHKIYDHLRRTCRERAVRQEPPRDAEDMDNFEASMMWLHNVAAECQSPVRRIELQEFRADLESALGKLPPRLAQVFQLYAIDDTPNPEVCRQLNISESNLWVMLHRARKLLRDQLGEWQPARLPESSKTVSA